MTTYRTDINWGLAIVREGAAVTPGASDYVCDGCQDQAEVWLDGRPLCRREPEVRAEAQLVAVVVNGDQALAERICTLLNAPPRCMEPTCPDFGDPDFGEATCPAEHTDGPETGLRSTESAQQPPVGGSGRPGGAEARSARFEVDAVALFGDNAAIDLDCMRCDWTALIDGPLDLAELNRRADEHAEVCR